RAIDIAGDRAVAQTKMAILHRAPLEGVLCDFTCMGRFYDFFERRPLPNPPPLAGEGREAARWGIVLRHPIYEKDRVDPVEPGAKLTLDPALLARFPEGYRYLAYLQTKHGYAVKPDMPGASGPELEALYRRGEAWLRGEAL